MTKREMRKLLDPAHFEPFVIVMNNSDRFEVPHRDFVVITESGTLHVYEPGVEDPEFASFNYAVVALHNVSSIEPVRRRTSA